MARTVPTTLVGITDNDLAALDAVLALVDNPDQEITPEHLQQLAKLRAAADNGYTPRQLLDQKMLANGVRDRARAWNQPGRLNGSPLQGTVRALERSGQRLMEHVRQLESLTRSS